MLFNWFLNNELNFIWKIIRLPWERGLGPLQSGKKRVWCVSGDMRGLWCRCFTTTTSFIWFRSVRNGYAIATEESTSSNPIHAISAVPPSRCRRTDSRCRRTDSRCRRTGPIRFTGSARFVWWFGIGMAILCIPLPFNINDDQKIIFTTGDGFTTLAESTDGVWFNFRVAALAGTTRADRRSRSFQSWRSGARGWFRVSLLWEWRRKSASPRWARTRPLTGAATSEGARSGTLRHHSRSIHLRSPAPCRRARLSVRDKEARPWHLELVLQPPESGGRKYSM